MAEGYEHRTIAPPGCGKTTWLSRQGSRAASIGRKVSILSLTRSAAAEIAGRELDQPLEAEDGSITTGTLHSQCYQALGYPSIAEAAKNISGWNSQAPEHWRLSPVKGKEGEEEQDETPGPRAGDQTMGLIKQLRGRMVPEEEWPQAALDLEKAWREWKEGEGFLDFADLIEKSVSQTVRAPGDPDLILVDECQDMDWLAMALIRHWGEAAGMLVTVGDPDQALYGWRGSDPEAFAGKELDPGRERVLDQSYRLPRAVHAKAMEWINRDPTRRRVKYQPRDEEGEVRNIPFHWEQAKAVLQDAEQYIAQGKSVMLLASCAYMLEPLLAEMRDQGLPFHNPLRRSQGNWNPMATREGAISGKQRLAAFLNLSQKGCWSAEDLRRWVGAAKVRRVINSNKARQALDELEDDSTSREGLPTLSQELLNQLLLPEALQAGQDGNLEWLRGQLTAARRNGMEFPIRAAGRGGLEALEREPLVIPGTIHSAKGGEADAVYLFPDLSRLGMAEWRRGQLGQAGIYRMFYVGMTRARETLVLCQPHPDTEAAPELGG